MSARPSDLLSEKFRVHPEGFWSTAHLLGNDGYDRMTTAAQRGWNAQRGAARDGISASGRTR